MQHTAIPDGFVPSDLAEGFLVHVGPLYMRPVAPATGATFALAFRASDQHANRYGVVHGGMLATLADTAIGANLARTGGQVETTLTLNLNLDFIAPAQVGEWIEAHVHLTKERGRVRFGDCELRVGVRTLLRASAVFYAPPDPK